MKDERRNSKPSGKQRCVTVCRQLCPSQPHCLSADVLTIGNGKVARGIGQWRDTWTTKLGIDCTTA